MNRKHYHWSDVLGNNLAAAEVLAMVPQGTDLIAWLEQQARELWDDDIEGLDLPALARQLTTEAGQ